MKTLLSIGQNSKLGKKTAVFNLPQAVTCPGKTSVCARICYAAKAEKLYKTAAAKRKVNLLASKQPEFVTLIIMELNHAVLRGTTQCRIHESGDFYDQTYLDKWIEIATECPEINFLAYTKSFHLDFSKAPANMKIYSSIDSSSISTPLPGRPTARIVLKGETPGAKEATCVHTADKHYCGEECNICWIGATSVYFPQH